MTQKTLLTGKKIKKIIFSGIIFIYISSVSLTFAQDLPVVDAGSVSESAILGTPVEEIISAANSGGLSTSQSFANLSPSIPNQAPEIPVLPSESPAESSSAGFNADSLEFLESEGGLSSAPQVDPQSPTAFSLAVKFFEKVVFKKSVEFAKRPKFEAGLDISGTPTFDKDTAGFAIIKKGNQKVAIDFERKYDSAPVVTATLSLQQYKDPEVRAAAEDLLLISDVKYIITNVSKKGFEIRMDSLAFSDIPFSWHALAVNDPKTFRKTGDRLDSGNDSNPSDDPSSASVNQSEASSFGDSPSDAS